ncbi:fused DNA polymerase I 5'-_3' exonuclease; 3'-_5' polymerase; 3'-_5' exonuclease [Candidatus Methylobacter favarea]|uniref:DNA polymerase I n=1 Tax=Candidatus Methylobacter favarea TaxID=2707345 RepID=A0A8S0WS22_9GAMM|nr:DNA polymerase I [Candidatus Methylobacter favarea]CAA9892431.1 fused DNA polymerase I 5'->3' exonuclease; 3'->5' polymerase; 3'->5' exonuclease [Candidatus Methylobacter favarea]
MSQQTKPRLILVDGSSFLYRAYHALPQLSNSQGEPTHAVYGVSGMLRKLIANYQSDYIAVVFDAPGKTFRNDLYEHYKAHRPPMPDDLRVQIEPLHKLIRAMGLPLIMEPGVEADDVLGALAQYAQQQGFSVIISTCDKDMAQLVTEDIILENTMSNTRLDIQGVIDKFGVKPEQIIDYLALTGDTSDNIPGVPKVGPKTAAKWLAQYGTVENLIACADEIKGHYGESLRANLVQLPLSKQLTTIKCDLHLPYVMEHLKRQPIDKAALKDLLTGLGFLSWLKTLDNSAEIEVVVEKKPAVCAPDYEIILTEQRFNYWFEQLEKASLFAFDTETTSLDYSKADIVGVSFAVTAGKAAYVPLAHDYPGVPNQLDRTEILEKLRPLLERPDKAKLGQNLKYDMHVLANHGIALRCIAHDTMLESYVLNSTATKHNMDDLAKEYLGVKTIHYEEVAGRGAKQIPFQEVSLEQAGPYAAEDADITLQLHRVLMAKLEQHPSLHKLYTDIEIPLISVLARIERNGVLIDTAMLARQSLELAGHIIAIEQLTHDLAGQTFNLGSPKQIQEILYDRQKLPVLRKTPTGQPSTDESVLQELALTYPLPKLILEYRSLSKLKSTYIDKLPQQLDAKTGRIHTSYHQAIAATGRLSSSDPNLQNIPIRSEEGRKIRQAFIASTGYKIVAADYSQIELRIMAHLSADDGLMKAFTEGHDVHRATAAEVFSIAPDQVTTDLRRSAKAINFGLIYGMSSFGLAQQLGLSRTQAQAYIDLYFSRYPGVKNYMDSIRKLAREQGFVETLFGRRLYLPEINSRNAASRQYAERTAINAPMQGTAADIIKRAMLATDQWLQQEKPDARMIMQVHDELVFEVAEDQLDYCTTYIRKIMCAAAELDVPLLVDIGIGNNWDEAH